MGSPAFDFSSIGGVPAAPPAAPSPAPAVSAPTGGAFDFSSVGGVAAPPPDSDTRTWHTTNDSDDTVVGRMTKGVAKGVAKSIYSGVTGVAGLIDAAPKLVDKAADFVTGGDGQAQPTEPQEPTLKGTIQEWAQKHVPSLATDPVGWQEKTGAFLEQAAEFAYGEGEARTMMKGLSLAEKMKKLAPVIEFLEEHKNIAKFARVGAAAADTGAVQGATGTAQALAHGATPSEALETGAITGVTGAALHGAMGTVGELRAQHQAAVQAVQDHLNATKVAEDGYQQALLDRAKAMEQARADWKAKIEQQAAEHAKAMENYQGNVADRQAAIDRAQTEHAANVAEFDRQSALHDQAVKDIRTKAIAQMMDQRQTVAQQTVKNVAKDATARIVDKMNDAREVPLAKTGEPLADETFAPIDKDAAIASTDTFGDAADHARAGAKEIYDKFSEATGGEFDRLKSARSKAYRAGDWEAYNKASDGIDELMKAKPDVLKPAEFKAAKQNWIDERDLDRIHNAVEGSFNGISEEQAAKPGVSPRTLKGGSGPGALQGRIGNLMRGPNAITPERLTELIGPDGLTNLQRASHLTSTPELRKATQTLAEEVARSLPAPEAPTAPPPLWKPKTPIKPAAPAAPSSIPKPAAPVLPPAPKPPRGSAAGTVGKLATTAMVGGAVAKATGIPYQYALPAAAATRYVLRQMVVNPKVGQLMDYAVTKGVDPKRAAGLIAATIAGTAGANREGQK